MFLERVVKEKRWWSSRMKRKSRVCAAARRCHSLRKPCARPLLLSRVHLSINMLPSWNLKRLDWLSAHMYLLQHQIVRSCFAAAWNPVTASSDVDHPVWRQTSSRKIQLRLWIHARPAPRYAVLRSKQTHDLMTLSRSRSNLYFCFRRMVTWSKCTNTVRKRCPPKLE